MRSILVVLTVSLFATGAFAEDAGASEFMTLQERAVVTAKNVLKKKYQAVVSWEWEVAEFNDDMLRVHGFVRNVTAKTLNGVGVVAWGFTEDDKFLGDDNVGGSLIKFNPLLPFGESEFEFFMKNHPAMKDLRVSVFNKPRNQKVDKKHLLKTMLMSDNDYSFFREVKLPVK